LEIVEWNDLVHVCCEHGNEPLGSLKCVELLAQLRNCRLLRNDYASPS